MTTDLDAYGWAPGFYTFKCVDCPPERDKFEEFADKRAWRCRKHAEEARANALLYISQD